MTGQTGGNLAAIGWAQASSTVHTTIEGFSNINAAQDVTIGATGSVSAKSTARTSNLLSSTINPSASAFALAFGATSLDDVADIQQNTTITANGNVNVSAKGTISNSPSASTAAFVDGLTGVSLAVPLDFNFKTGGANTANAYINGKITALGNSSSAQGPTFSPSAVNTTNDTITLSTVNGLPGGLTNGQQITYTATGGNPIGGLQNGGTYTVIVLNPTTIQLSNAPVIALDPSGTSSNSTQTLAWKLP